MRDASRIAYAQARVQARFGSRPDESLWRELEAGRELPHLIEMVRASGLRAAVESLGASMDGHALESRLRSRWATACTEIAGWYPPTWKPSMTWLGWLPWVAPLTWLVHRDDVPGWMQDDPLLAKLAAAGPDERAEQLAESPFAPLTEAWQRGGNLAQAWHAEWRSSWPDTDTASRRGLLRLDDALAAFLPGPSGQAFDPLVDATDVAVTRIFRRQAGTPVAGLALLVLLGLDHMRLRAALAVARSFGQVRAA